MADQPPVILDSLEALMGGLVAAELRPVAVHVPEMGGSVFVLPLTADEWLDPDAGGKLPDGATPAQRRGWAIARWLCDENGKRIAQPDNLPLFDRFAALPFQAAHRILSTAGVVNGAAEKNV